MFSFGFAAPEAVEKFYGDTTSTYDAGSDPKAVQWTYDAFGRISTESTAIGRVKKLKYDKAGNIKHVVTPAGDTIRMEYDVLNRLSSRWAGHRTYPTTTTIDGQADVQPESLWRFPFIVSAGGGREVLGDSASFEYDVMGNMKLAESRDAAVRRTYTQRGEIKLDSLDIRILNSTDTVVVPGEDGPPIIRPRGMFRSFGLEYTYDGDGRLAELRYPGHTSAHPKRVAYAYHPITGRLVSVTDMLDNVTTYQEYDADGRPTVVLHPGSLFEQLSYDDDGRLFRRSVGAMFTDSILFDPAGRIVKVYQDPGAANNLTVTNEYDGLGHVTASIDSVRSNPQIERFVMDGLGRLGLRWTSPHHQSPDNHDAVEESSYDADHRLSEQSAGWPIEYPDTVAGDYPRVRMLTYDLNGNVETVGSHAKYTDANGAEKDWVTTSGEYNYYDVESRLRYRQRQTKNRSGDPLVPSSDSLGAWEEYHYDALGRRVAVRTLGGGLCTAADCYSSERFFVWAGEELAYEMSKPADDGLEKEGQYGAVYYAHAGSVDRPVSVVHEDESLHRDALFPHVNWRGLVTEATDSAGNDCTEEGGVCWGLARPGDRQNAFRSMPKDVADWDWYGSLMADQQDVTGLLYRRNRYYDAETGQFTQEDPIGIAGGLNLYGYANGDPINYSDPFGLCAPFPLCLWSESGMAEAVANGLDAFAGILLKVEQTLGGIGSDLVTAVEGRDPATGEDVGVGRRIFSGVSAGLTVGGAAAGGAGFSAKQLAKFEGQLAEHGIGSLLRSQRRLTGRLNEHLDKLDNIRAAGGFTSSVEREIRNYRAELAAIEDVLGRAR